MSHQHKHQVDSKNLVYSILLNVAITLAQIIGGILSNSLALISDALHNFSDVLSLIFSLVAHNFSKRKASINQTFGYKRAEIIAAFINSILLIIVAIILLFGAINRFIHPSEISSKIVIYLAILGIVGNGLSVLFLKKDAEHNLNMKSAYLHLLTDMLASIAVLFGGILMQYFNWFWVDSLLTIIISLYLIKMGITVLRPSFEILMLFTPSHIDIKEIVREVHQIEGVEKLHHIHVWSLNEDELHLEAHLDCKEDINLTEFNILLEKIEILLFEKFKINHVNVQPEFKKIESSKDFIVQD